MHVLITYVHICKDLHWRKLFNKIKTKKKKEEKNKDLKFLPFQSNKI